MLDHIPELNSAHHLKEKLRHFEQSQVEFQGVYSYGVEYAYKCFQDGKSMEHVGETMHMEFDKGIREKPNWIKCNVLSRNSFHSVHSKKTGKYTESTMLSK